MGKARNGLTAKQKAFADSYLQTKNATESASRVYKVKSRKSATVVGSENLAKPDIIAYLRGQSQLASENIVNLANKARSERIKLDANKDILDRAGYKAREALDITSVSFSLSLLFDKTKEEPKENS